MTHPPRLLVQEHHAELERYLEAIHDGDPVAVHDARVLTRRLREVLRLLGDDGAVEHAGRVVRKAGRALGKVRELDVMQEALRQLEDRFSISAAVATAARRRLRERQHRARRTLVQKIDALPLDAGTLVPPIQWSGIGAEIVGRGWRHRLRARLERRAHGAMAAVRHASGIYFPGRVHRARIHLKKLRYVVEAAHVTGAWRPPHLLRDLRRIQGDLGQLHDAQVLLDEIEDLAGHDAPADAVGVLKDALRAEIDSGHKRYLSKRPRIEAMGAACLRFAEGAGVIREASLPLAVAVGALSATAMFAHTVVGREAAPGWSPRAAAVLRPIRPST